jgi:hypothetical protein
LQRAEKSHGVGNEEERKKAGYVASFTAKYGRR